MGPGLQKGKKATQALNTNFWISSVKGGTQEYLNPLTTKQEYEQHAEGMRTAQQRGIACVQCVMFMLGRKCRILKMTIMREN
jgi:hypothetical protein